VVTDVGKFFQNQSSQSQVFFVWNIIGGAQLVENGPDMRSLVDI